MKPNATMAPIQMVDLVGQYSRIKAEIDEALLSAVGSAQYINGPQVKQFEDSLAKYLGADQVIGCANGTDALQIALMALGLQPGDEVIVPAFTYVATAEVIGLLGLTPVMVEVDPETFNVTADVIRAAVTPKTKAVVPVHLFGQSCDLDSLMEVAVEFGLYVIEDNAQAIGADYFGSSGTKKTGTIGHIGCTSFFPSKNLGCFGDGGAIFTNDAEIAARMRMVANHGQAKKYYHSVIGVNSRLDTLQAAILNVKLKYLDEYCDARLTVADRYDRAFGSVDGLEIPKRSAKSTHVFHQYTLKVAGRKRDELKSHLESKGVPSMVYYPVPLYKQLAFEQFVASDFELPVTEELCRSVISLPIHTEMKDEVLDHVISSVTEFFGASTASGGAN